MLNYIFSGLIILSLLFSFLNGTYVETISGGIEGATEAVSLMLTLLAVMSFFNGVLKIAEKSGITKNISRFIKQILKPLFSDVNDEKTFGSISMNITANLLGMGNAATPIGIDAIKRMHSLSKNKKVPTNSMCLFIILNTASIQLIPSNILAIRIKYNSLMPYSVVVPIWLSSICALVCGVFFAKIFERYN